MRRARSHEPWERSRQGHSFIPMELPSVEHAREFERRVPWRLRGMRRRQVQDRQREPPESQPTCFGHRRPASSPGTGELTLGPASSPRRVPTSLAFQKVPILTACASVSKTTRLRTCRSPFRASKALSVDSEEVTGNSRSASCCMSFTTHRLRPSTVLPCRWSNHAGVMN